MTIRITTDVFCNKCGSWINGPVSYKIERRKARENSKRNGWVVKIGGGGEMIDLCPDCQKAMEENYNERCDR